jgi:hypothetical protein
VPISVSPEVLTATLMWSEEVIVTPNQNAISTKEHAQE